jgi:polyhydroxyalkanoate synthesis regulator phasin
VLQELIICRPNEFETTLVNDSEILMYTESKINKVTSLINSCKVLLKNVEGKMMVNEQKRYIQTVMQKNVNSMMKNKPKLKKKVTIIVDNDNRSRLDSEYFKDSDY